MKKRQGRRTARGTVVPQRHLYHPLRRGCHPGEPRADYRAAQPSAVVGSCPPARLMTALVGDRDSMTHTLYQTRGPLDQTSVLFVSNRDMLADPPPPTTIWTVNWPPLDPSRPRRTCNCSCLSAAPTRDFAGQQWLELKQNREKTLAASRPRLELSWNCPGNVLEMSWQFPGSACFSWDPRGMNRMML